MDINFELYKVFYYAAKYLSFSEASKSLYISQSAVSQSIASLEEKLGCKLLFRNTRQVALTQEGKVLFDFIGQAFNLIKTGERNIADMHSLLKGDVRIGASDTICKYYLLPYLKKFNEMYPGVKIHITNRTSPQCFELLRRGDVDFSIVNMPNDYNNPGIEAVEIKKIHDVFIAGNNYINLKGRELKLKCLENYPVMVLEKDSTSREFFNELLKNYEVSVIPEIELGSVDLLMEMAKIGLGISYVMEDCIEDELYKGNIFKLNIVEKIPERSLSIITHRGIPLPPASERFISLLCS